MVICRCRPIFSAKIHEKLDQSRYQTVFAKHRGAVAAPTAGLHFTEEFFASLKSVVESIMITSPCMWVPGRFSQSRAENLEDHVMHSEYLEVDQQVVDKIRLVKERGGRVIAVGTTVVRSLETAVPILVSCQPFRGKPAFSKAWVRFSCSRCHGDELSFTAIDPAHAGVCVRRSLR